MRLPVRSSKPLGSGEDLNTEQCADEDRVVLSCEATSHVGGTVSSNRCRLSLASIIRGDDIQARPVPSASVALAAESAQDGLCIRSGQFDGVAETPIEIGC